MKKIFFIIFVAIMLTACGSKEEFNQSLTEEKHYVCYDTVNLRSGPSAKSDKVGELHLGYTVMLTGKMVRYPFSDVHSLWYETTEGYWIVSDAVLSEFQYNDKFHWN